MQNRYLRLFGLALLLDGILLIITIPLTKLVMSVLLPTNLITAPTILWTYGLVIFSCLLIAVLVMLWVFQAWYEKTGTFFELVLAMVAVMGGVLLWNKGQVMGLR